MVVLLIVLLGESQSHKLGMLSVLESLPGAVGWNVQLTTAKQSSLYFPPGSPHPTPILDVAALQAQDFSLDSILSSGFQMIFLSRPLSYNAFNFTSMDLNLVSIPP